MALFVSIAFLSAYTADWHQPAKLTPGPLAPRQQVEVWQGRDFLRWHAVAVTPDTVSGVDFLAPIDCDSCRIAISRAAVDSIRLGNPSAGFWKSVGLGTGILLGTMFVYCAVEDCPTPD